MSNPTLCTVETCDRDVYVRGLCRAHYDRLMKYGDLRADVPLRKLPTRSERQDLPGRLAAHFVVTDGGCWEWQGEVSASGYAQMSWQGRRRGNTRTAHRLVWENFVEPIPQGDEWTLDHLCHTEDASCPGGTTCPHRRCVNPDHLEVVTRGENSIRGGGLDIANANRALRMAARTTCVNGHDIARTHTTPSGSRYCRDCRNELARRRRQRAKGGASSRTAHRPEVSGGLGDQHPTLKAAG